MNGHLYLRYELIRTFRNRRFFIFSLVFPLVLYFVIAAPNRNEQSFAGTGISAPLYYMVGLVSFGTMTAVLASGGRIAVERSVGWTRQLRITPLSTRSYFRAKIATGYGMALVSIAVLYASGLSLGVHMSGSDWLRMTALILVALIPFAAMGILLGHLLTADSVGPAIGGVTALFALLGGTWFPIGGTGVMHDIAVNLPSYWLVQASRVPILAHGWGVRGWLVIAIWTLVVAAVAVRAYRRDTQRA
jgi:ABC-2 type transport system permease protein